MKHSHALAYLRQLCCLGLNKAIVLPEFLNAIKHVIPSNSNTYTGVDPHEFKPSDFILDFEPANLAPTIQSVLSSYWTPERTAKLAAWFAKHPVLARFDLIDSNFVKSDAYNLLMRPLDQHYVLLTFIMDHGRPVGAINLFRSINGKPFTKNDQLHLIHLLPYIAHALQTQSRDDIQFCDHGASGMLVMDGNGRIQFQSETAKRLLQLADYPVQPVDVRVQENSVMPKLAQLCQNLNTIFVGKDAAPPSWSHTNGRGRFLFRAYWLDKLNQEPGGLIGVTIEHQEPLMLKLVRALRDLPLSPTQKEVALLLAQGFSTEQIGVRLHIKSTTVKDHIRKIFDKLDIHHREELLPKLLAIGWVEACGNPA